MYASSDVNIVMMMFFGLFLLRKIPEFPSRTWTHNLQIAGEKRLTGDLKIVGSSHAWELRYFSE